MDIQFEQYKKLNAFLAYFFPGQDFEKKEVNSKTAEHSILFLLVIMDALIKGENLYKKRNLILPENHSFFTLDPVEIMTNINLFLYRFDSRIFNFTRTERQTFIFIIENIIDYFRRARALPEKKENSELFNDYRFWIENLFKMVNQKIAGTIYSSKKLNLKNFFTSDDVAHNELIYSNTSVSFSLSPFVIIRDGKSNFLSRIGNLQKGDGQLIYTDIETGSEFILENAKYDMKIFEFAFANLDFQTAEALKPKLDDPHNNILENSSLIETACNYHKERLFLESFNLLKELSLETLDLPLVHLLQIKNLMNIDRIFEVKKLMQKFMVQYPYYSEGYEIMGDIYVKEEDYDSAVNYFEKVLKFSQNKRVAEKLKRVKESLEKNKQQQAKEKNESFFDLTDSVFHGDEKLLNRDKEMRQLIEILLSDSRRNAMIVGDSGVGKTSLIRLLAAKMLNHDVPDHLRDKRLKEINFVSLLTGSKYRGQFEEKVLKLLTDFKTMKSILVLEDVHLMIASGVPRGTSLDLVNILKPFLRDKSVQVIATTSYEEFKNSIEKDNTLMGFFQKMTIGEMTLTDTRKVLKNLSEDIFSRDKIFISEPVIDQILESAKRDIRDKKFPDSAVMLTERAIAKVKYKLQIDELNKPEVEFTDVAEVITDILNLPSSHITISLKQRLLDLKEKLLNEIAGQDEAINRVAANIITSKLNFDIKRGRPDGVFLFIGPTGVGKTETALALSRALYGSEDHLIRIDMSEYMEKFTYSRFVGAAPGYVGYMDTNQLTDKVRQNPYSIILLDEIEKADSQLLNIFLQVFDAGRLTDARGNIVDFSHATIIMTSNIGTSLFSQTSMGYQNDLGERDVSHASLLKALKKYFSPEFLNRVDEILIFNHLKENDIKKIIHNQLETTREQLKKQDKELILKDEVVDYIVRTGYSKEYGARHLGRIIRKTLLEEIAHLSLEKEWDDARQIICSINPESGEIAVELGNFNHDTLSPVDKSEYVHSARVEQG